MTELINSINPEDGSRGKIDNTLVAKDDFINEKFCSKDLSASLEVAKESKAGIRKLKNEIQNQSNIQEALKISRKSIINDYTPPNNTLSAIRTF